MVLIVQYSVTYYNIGAYYYKAYTVTVTMSTLMGQVVCANAPVYAQNF